MNSNIQQPIGTASYTFKNVRAVLLAAQVNSEYEQTISINQTGSTDGPSIFTGIGTNSSMSSNTRGPIYYLRWTPSNQDVGNITLELTFNGPLGNTKTKLISEFPDVGNGNLNIVNYGTEGQDSKSFDSSILTLVGIS